MISAIEQRVRHYWTLRSHDFGAVRKNELDNDMGRFEEYMDRRRDLIVEVITQLMVPDAR